MLNNYFESFENAGAFTPGYTFYDENKDGKNWVVRANTVSEIYPLFTRKQEPTGWCLILTPEEEALMQITG
ncbi:hypothetical protein LDL59_00775 [Kaistella anthropi]|nr:hypothetical protein [Kaistella anthropi]